MLLDRVDYSERVTEADGAVPVMTFTRSWTTRSTHHLAVVGPHGQDLVTADVGPATGSAYAHLVPGGAGDDILLEEWREADLAHSCTWLVISESCSGGQRSRAHAVSVYDGTTLARRWTSTASGWFGWAYPLGGDVDGDGAEDFLHAWVEFGADASQDEVTSAVLSGAGGQRLWSTDVVAGYTGIGDVDGDGRDDLLGTAWSYGEDSESALTLHRAAGATGATLLHTRHDYAWTDDYDEFLSPYVAGDADHDGTSDIVILRYRVPCQDGMCDPERTDTSAVVESGRTGAALWSVGDAGGQDWLAPVGDVDRDGGVDFSWSSDSQPGHVRIGVHRGAQGQALWQRDVAGAWAVLVPVGDVDGDGGGDLALVSAPTGDDPAPVQVTVVTGADGVPRWSAS